jgi:hypothetical protein
MVHAPVLRSAYVCQQNQVEALRSLGVTATAVNSSLPPAQTAAVCQLPLQCLATDRFTLTLLPVHRKRGFSTLLLSRCRQLALSRRWTSCRPRPNSVSLWLTRLTAFRPGVTTLGWFTAQGLPHTSSTSRPAFQRLCVFKDRYPHIPVAAFTATATAKCKTDICQCLRMPTARVFAASFNRPKCAATCLFIMV